MRKILGVLIVISLVVSIGIVIAYNDPSMRYTVGKILGLKNNPQQYGSELNIEEYFIGLSNPTTMAFSGKDIIFLEKNSGKIRMIRSGQILDEPLYDFNVSNEYESGLLGIFIDKQEVYIYVTEAIKDGGEPIADNVYKFSWDGEKLTDRKLMKSLPSFATWHNGGIITMGLDGTIFAIRGDQREPFGKLEYGVLQKI